MAKPEEVQPQKPDEMKNDYVAVGRVFADMLDDEPQAGDGRRFPALQKPSDVTLKRGSTG
ncbi:MAG: hypothetical protein AAGE80_03440 [Pseudomonadota bacterium]